MPEENRATRRMSGTPRTALHARKEIADISDDVLTPSMRTVFQLMQGAEHARTSGR